MAEADLEPCTDDEQLPAIDRQFYQFLVGALMHAYVCTRPELGCAVQALSKFVAKPGPLHMIAAKRVLRYLQATKTLALTYSCPQNPALLHELLMFSDANWGGTHTDRRSVGGGCCLFNGAAVFWHCKRQPTITLSSAESEYMQLSIMSLLALYARNVARDIGIPVTKPTITFEDNQPAIKIATNPISSNRSRHIDIRYHSIREQVLRGNIMLIYLPTTEMIADIFTKPLGPILFQRFRNIILGHVPFEHDHFRKPNTVVPS